MNRLHQTSVGDICQWIDASFASASAPSQVLYQGIPAAVVQGSLDSDSLQTMHRAAKTSFKNVALSFSDCVSVEAFLIALNTHAVRKHDEHEYFDGVLVGRHDHDERQSWGGMAARATGLCARVLRCCCSTANDAFTSG